MSKRALEKENDSVQYYGFLESVERPRVPGPYNRTHLVFDVVDARWFEDGNIQDRNVEKLSIVRVLTTERRLRDRFDIEAVEGGWYRLTFNKARNQPAAWVINGRNYSAKASRTNLTSLERLGSQTRGIATTKPVLPELKEWCSIAGRTAFATSAVATTNNVVDLRVRILDVGQANCAAIHGTHNDASIVLGYFDVGRPAFFHHGTFPKRFKEQQKVPAVGFVALSHWDFDHYSLALTDLPQLQSLRWYAPRQPVGPTAARLQANLGGRLSFLNAPNYPLSSDISMWRGTGVAADRNDSGYVLRAMTSSGAVLLTGDVSYSSIPKNARTDLAAMGVTHHGGKGSSNPPTPKTKGCIAAISYGAGNRYGHPDPLHVGAHTALYWMVRHTARHNGVARGDVWLPK